MLIASPEHLNALKDRSDLGHTQAFADTEALRALDVITRQRPSVIALERLFAATSRGAALINRIKADPGLTACEIRIVTHDSIVAGGVGVGPPKGGPHISSGDPRIGSGDPRISSGDARISSGGAHISSGDPHIGSGGAHTSSSSPVAQAAPAPAAAAPLDQRGTRRAPRTRVAAGVEVLVDGSGASLVDISAIGAQVVSSTVLKPNQRLRMMLPDPSRMVRLSAVVAWASFEMPKGGPRYRAGIEFLDADATAVGDWIARLSAR